MGGYKTAPPRNRGAGRGGCASEENCALRLLRHMLAFLLLEYCDNIADIAVKNT